MNEQVRRYIEHLKYVRIHGLTENTRLVRERRHIVIEPDEMFLTEMSRWSGNPGNFVVEPTDEDFDFVWTVRKLAAKNGVSPTEMPKPPRILQAKYMLLIPPPIHNFDDPVEEKGIVNIYERGKKGVKTLYATVNGTMREAYKRSKGREKTLEEKAAGVEPAKKKIEIGVPDDMTIAHWWIEDNRNAIHDGVMGKDAKDGPMSSPSLKIVRRGTNSVDLAFRYAPKFYGWNVIRDIPIDMPAFRQRAEENGWQDKAHAKKLLKAPSRQWMYLAASDTKEDAPHEDGISRTSYGDNRSYNLGFFKMEDDPSDDYGERYTNDLEFRKHVEKIVIRATNKHVEGINVDEHQVDVKFGKGEPINPWKMGLINYKITQTGYGDRLSIPPDKVIEIMQDSRMKIIGMSGYVNFDWKTVDTSDPDSPVNHFLRKEAANGVITSLREVIRSKKNERQVDDKKGEKGGMDLRNMAVADDEDAKANFLNARKGDDESDDTPPSKDIRQRATKSSEFVSSDLDDAKVNMADFWDIEIEPKLPTWLKRQSKPDERQTRLILRFSQANTPIAKSFKILIDKLGLGEPAKYAPQVPAHVESRRHTFRQYLEWRMGR